MDKEQAIEIIETHSDDILSSSLLGQALNMAIEALKAQLSQEGTTKGTTSDLVSRTETVEHLRRMLEATVPNTDYDDGFIDGVEFGISTVSTMPNAQPEPHEGHWINGKCDLCGEHAPFWAMASTYHESNYCPCCGAKMKGVRHESY